MIDSVDVREGKGIHQYGVLGNYQVDPLFMKAKCEYVVRDPQKNEGYHGLGRKIESLPGFYKARTFARLCESAIYEVILMG